MVVTTSRNRIIKISARLLWLVVFGAIACSPEQNQPEQETAPEDAAGSLLLYGLGKDAPLPERVTLDDGSCWDLTKVPEPWVAQYITTKSLSLRASTDDLGLARLPLSSEQQNFVKLTFSERSDERRWVMVQPPNYYEKTSNREKYYKEELHSTKNFVAYGLRKGGDNSHFYLVSNEKNASCKMSYGAWAVNASLWCVREFNNHRISFRIPRKAIGQLDKATDDFARLATILACFE